MTKREEFIQFFDTITTGIDVPENVQAYVDAIRDSKSMADKPQFTDNGKAILKYLQEQSAGTMHKAKDIAEGMFMASKSVSGAMRKLVTDGYVEKCGKDPVVYMITEKGKTVNFDDEIEGEN